MLQSIAYFTLAAFLEIIGCFAFWAFAKNNKSFWWLPLGVICLICFAYLLTFVDMEEAGRSYAAYGGIYITASLLWLVFVENSPLDRWDLIGAGLSLVGASIILVAHISK